MSDIKKIDVKIIIEVICFYLRRALTTALTLRLRRSVYVCPVPTKTIGCPVVYVIEMAAPTYKNNEDIVTDCLVIRFHFVNFQFFLSYLSWYGLIVCQFTSIFCNNGWSVWYRTSDF